MTDFYPEHGPGQGYRSPYAYTVSLTEQENENAPDALEKDVYFISTRILAYQLLHHPDTRTNTSIPFVVMVSPGVSQRKRDRLTKDGAMVLEFPHITIDWMTPGLPRWKHVMDKLNAFRLTQFDKVLLLDLDIAIFKRLDAIFEEPEAQLLPNKGDKSQAPEDEGLQPEQYLMAADSKPVGGDKHGWLAERNGVLNAGFVLMHPSQAAFDHMLRVANIEGRTPGAAPENNLWEYIYRKDGNMPYTPLKRHWVMNSPTVKDYDWGIAAVHEKWWRNSIRDKALRELLLKNRWMMEGYWTHPSQ